MIILILNKIKAKSAIISLGQWIMGFNHPRTEYGGVLITLGQRIMGLNHSMIWWSIAPTRTMDNGV